MEKKHEISEVKKEYEMYVEGLKFPIRARILVNYKPESNNTYSWEISHYYKGSETASTAYVPSSTYDTLDQTRGMLFVYMECFTTIGVVENSNY